MESNLPAAPSETALAETEAPPPARPARRPLSVAFLPLALIAFIVVAFVMAAWTFLAAGTGG
jgi:hypothetical protein